MKVTTTVTKLGIDTTVEPVAITTTQQPVELVLSEIGIQGPQGPEGPQGETGPQGPSGVLAVTDPIVNSGSSTSAELSLAYGQNLTLGDANELKVTDDLTAIDSVQFDLLAAEASAVGKLAWNDTDGTLNLGLKGGNVTLQLGQEQVILVKDKDNTGLAEGVVVYQHGSDGGNITVGLAKADSESTSSQVLGVMTEPTTGGAKGFCTTFGLVRDLNTSALTEGAAVWLSPTVAGGMTTTKPANGYHLVLIGYCLRSHAVNGVIFVKVANGYELEELHDVDIVTPSDGEVLAYEASSGLWKNKTPTGDISEVTVSAPLTGGGSSGAVSVGLSLGSGLTTSAGSLIVDSSVARRDAANAFTVGGHTITNTVAATKPLVIKGAASQTANLQEWQNSAATVLGSFGASGTLAATAFSSLASQLFLSQSQNGGYVQASKATAAIGNPGADKARLYFRDGTNAGTLKLVVRAGAAGAETTIFDNIPQ